MGYFPPMVVRYPSTSLQDVSLTILSKSKDGIFNLILSHRGSGKVTGAG